MADQQTRRMHTLPQSYQEPFSVPDSTRRTPAVWRFDRLIGEAKLVGVRDAEVVKDIYTVFSERGTPDTVIEDDILRGVEGAFCTTRNSLINRTPLAHEDWIGLARFIAVQLLRTPRALQLMRDELDADGVGYSADTPQRVMVVLIQRWILRVGRMNGIIVHNETAFPLLTCDNPAVAWKKSGNGFQLGVNQRDPDLVITCPLTPDLMFVAYQTAESLRAVLAERHDGEAPPETFHVHIDVGTLPPAEVKRMNLICVANAHRYIYASYNDARLRRFLTRHFFGQPAAVRRRDLKPIGHPV